MIIIGLKLLIIVAAFGVWWLGYGLECWINGGASLAWEKRYPMAMHIECMKQDWRWLWNPPEPGYPALRICLFWHVGFLVLPTVSAFMW